MAAPKRPNTAAATARVVRRGDETAAARLRSHRWLVIPPEAVAALPAELARLSRNCACCSCCVESCTGCADGSRREILAVPHIGQGHQPLAGARESGG